MAASLWGKIYYRKYFLCQREPDGSILVRTGEIA